MKNGNFGSIAQDQELPNVKSYCGVLSKNKEYQEGPFFAFFEIKAEHLNDQNDCTPV
jgi:hypothetical protein